MTSKENFWKSISILIKNYHAVNKKIFASELVNVYKLHGGIDKFLEQSKEFTDTDEVKKCLEDHGMNFSYLECPEDEIFKEISSRNFAPNASYSGFVFTLKLLRKSNELPIAGLGVIAFNQSNFTCRFFSNELIDFSVELNGNENDLRVIPISKDTACNKELNWCNFVLKPKLLKWSENTSHDDKPAVQSLKLISMEEYNNLYQELKRKYSQPLLEIWPESTDPLKFIYEDLAIAAYLIRLWIETESVPRAFADLGCGNGLLVYVLNQEGYLGYGYDLRRRKIWQLYPENTKLFEQSITPPNFKMPSEVDWIIGNHSDELSPWIPAMAALYSYEMKFFLLPCCAFEFSGSKFQRRNAKLSCYNDFLEYVTDISVKCGFETLSDRLKIPSTKRLAVIGIKRVYEASNFDEMTSIVNELLLTENKMNSVKIRDKHEAVRNCTQIEKTILNEIVLKIFNFMLNAEVSDTIVERNNQWNCGRAATIRDLVKCLSSDDLKNIKSECGGLKTLLKNKHEIFELSGELVHIRRPTPKDVNSLKPQTIKKRPCFFVEHHPNGCPLTDETCTFIHDLQALA